MQHEDPGPVHYGEALVADPGPVHHEDGALHPDPGPVHHGEAVVLYSSRSLNVVGLVVEVASSLQERKRS